MKLVSRLVATMLLFFSFTVISGQVSDLPSGYILNSEGAEVHLRAHFEIGVKAPDDISLWYKDELLATLSLYGSPLQKEMDWIVRNPFQSEAEFQDELEYLSVRNVFGQEIPVRYFEILPL